MLDEVRFKISKWLNFNLDIVQDEVIKPSSDALDTAEKDDEMIATDIENINCAKMHVISRPKWNYAHTLTSHQTQH